MKGLEGPSSPGGPPDLPPTSPFRLRARRGNAVFRAGLQAPEVHQAPIPVNNPEIRGVPLCGKFGNGPFFLARSRWSKFSPLPAVAAALLLSIPLVKKSTQEVLFWPCLSVRSTPFACLERAQRRENISRGLAGRFFLQRNWLHLLNSAPKRVLSWQVFKAQISAC